ncbi:hypothetical protein UFOVP190_107 [uncultured Caudovirales phage]|uniref:Tail tube protein n=1 Tax=uncultured Caudovirales phage TaxID=2100421 RepID=A0A6J7WHD1_9CAUD|nr:hypothetical protein UFOVP190_107 [uncultured Caudovirales phage]
MAVASLSKFTVPLNNSQSASSQGLLMPKLKYRFRATFNNFGVSNPTTELTKQVVDIKRPNVNFNPITLDVYNSKVYLQGKPEWQETTINFRDDATGSVSKLVGEQIQKQFDFMEQASAPSGVNYKFQLLFEMLDGGNGATTINVLEAWELDGCFLSSVDYGDMAYNSSDPVQIACNIKFDNAVQTVGGGVGTTVIPLNQQTTVN